MVIKQITNEAKKLRKANPSLTWQMALKKAGAKYRGVSVKKTSRSTGATKKRIPIKRTGIKKVGSTIGSLYNKIQSVAKSQNFDLKFADLDVFLKWLIKNQKTIFGRNITTMAWFDILDEYPQLIDVMAQNKMDTDPLEDEDTAPKYWNKIKKSKIGATQKRIVKKSIPLKSTGIKKIGEYKEGDIYKQPVNAKWNTSNDLFKKHKSYIINKSDKKVLEVFDYPFEAIKKQESYWNAVKGHGRTQVTWKPFNAKVSGDLMILHTSSGNMRKKTFGALAGPKDLDAVREIELFIENDGDLYRQQTYPILKNLTKKYVKGTFKIEPAAKLFRYLIDNAMKKYHKLYGSRGSKWYDLLSTSDRQYLAEIMAKDTLVELNSGNRWD